MSARLQRFPDKRHELTDDMESFYHVLNWCALLCLHHTDADDINAIAQFMSMMYDFVSHEIPERGHPDKLKYMAEGRSFVTFPRLESGEEHPLTWVLPRLANLFKLHYHHVPYADSRVGLPRLKEKKPVERILPASMKRKADKSPGANQSHLDDLEAPDSAKSPLLDHSQMLEILWHPLTSEEEKFPWPMDRAVERQIVLGVRSKGKRTSQSRQRDSGADDSKRSRTGVSPFVQATSAAPRPRRTYASSARGHSRSSKSARGSPAHSDSSTRSGSPITGASSALSTLDLQEQLKPALTNLSELLAPRGRQPRSGRPPSPSNIPWLRNTGSQGIGPTMSGNVISLNYPFPGVISLDDPSPDVISLNDPFPGFISLNDPLPGDTEFPLRPQYPESYQRSTRGGDFDDVASAGDDNRESPLISSRQID